jgi:hypothetical protein
MAERPTAEDFKKHAGTQFRVRVEAPRPLDLELHEVKSYESREHEHGMMERYSLFFYGPGDMMLNQGTYTFEHPSMGEQVLFIVPISRDDRGFRYEVVFNYFLDK